MPKPLRVTFQAGTKRVTIKIEETAPTPRKRRSIQAHILKVLTTKPISPKRLAAKCGRPWNSYFRAALAALSRARKIDRTPDGVCLRVSADRKPDNG